MGGQTVEGTRLQLRSNADRTHAVVVSTLMEAWEVVRGGLVSDSTVKDVSWNHFEERNTLNINPSRSSMVCHSQLIEWQICLLCGTRFRNMAESFAFSLITQIKCGF